MGPKVVSRFRNRKINFKVKLPIHVGSFDVLYDEQSDAATPGSGEHGGPSAGKERQGVETGVDKEEEGEVHLQNAISASAAALIARTSAGRSYNIGSTSNSVSRGSAGPYIPTPDATGLVSDYGRLYPQKAFAEPTTLIRFSDTVEDVVGPAYTLDDEDLAFLRRYNGQYANGVSANNASSGIHERALRSPRKEKGKDSISTPAYLSDDDFEIIMDHYENYTDDRVPTLSLDLLRLPSSSEMEATFLLPENSHLAHLRIFCRLVYAYWKERRVKREGRSVIPHLDYDESREDNPYVCFRRREAKMARKTRRSETNNLDRLLRLRVDLSTAREVLQLVLDREQAKRSLLREEAAIVDARGRLRDCKRQVHENEGEDDLLLPRERRKRRRTDDVVPTSIMASSLSTSLAGLKTTIRLPGRDVASNATVPMPQLCSEPLNAFKDRTQTVCGRIDRDIERKRAADREWEDFTDGAYCPLPLSIATRYFRCPDIHRRSDSPTGPATTFTMPQNLVHALGGVRPAFRKRIGRGGRIFLDRIASRSCGTSTVARSANMLERWSRDSDLLDEIAPGLPVILDDHDLPSMLHRLSLLRKGDMHSMLPSAAWLEQAAAYQTLDAEVLPPVQVIGRLPGRQSATYAPPQLQGGLPVPLQPLMNGANASLGANAASQNQSVVNQMLLAATHAQQITQAPSGVRRTPALANGQAAAHALMSNVPRRGSNAVSSSSLNVPFSASLAAQQQHNHMAAAVAPASHVVHQMPASGVTNGVGQRSLPGAGIQAINAS